MQESYGTSPSGNLKEAVRGISNPAFLILMSNAEQFETHVAELEELYPGVPSIGCIGMSYQTSVTEKGVSVTAFEGVEAVTDVLEQASIMPVKYISRVEKALQKINAVTLTPFSVTLVWYHLRILYVSIFVQETMQQFLRLCTVSWKKRKYH